MEVEESATSAFVRFGWRVVGFVQSRRTGAVVQSRLSCLALSPLSCVSAIFIESNMSVVMSAFVVLTGPGKAQAHTAVVVEQMLARQQIETAAVLSYPMIARAASVLCSPGLAWV